MRSPSPDALWALVAGGNSGVLATVGPSGLPHLSNVYYVPDPHERLVRISTIADRVKGRNLRRDPRATLHVAGADFFNFAVVEGQVTCAVAEEVGDAANEELHALHGVFNGPEERPAFDEHMIAEHRMIVRLRPGRLYGLLRS